MMCSAPVFQFHFEARHYSSSAPNNVCVKKRHCPLLTGAKIFGIFHCSFVIPILPEHCSCNAQFAADFSFFGSLMHIVLMCMCALIKHSVKSKPNFSLHAFLNGYRYAFFVLIKTLSHGKLHLIMHEQDWGKKQHTDTILIQV